MEEDRRRSVRLWIGRKLAVSVTARPGDIKKLRVWGFRGTCSGLGGLKNTKIGMSDGKCQRGGFFRRNQSQSCLKSDGWFIGWGVKVILFRAGCGGQEALRLRIRHGQNTPLKTGLTLNLPPLSGRRRL